MDKFDGTFREWLRTGHTAHVDPLDGGTLVPAKLRVRAPGFGAALLRLIGNEGGWEVIDMQRYLSEIHMPKGKVKHG